MPVMFTSVDKDVSKLARGPWHHAGQGMVAVVDK
jgi:hypothetical protein